MKKLATILWLSAWATGAFSQGLINFINTPSTLSSAFINGGVAATDGPVGAWYYGLLIGSGNDPTKFLFTGVYATNLLTPGRFFGGTSVQVPGWIPGVATNYAVAIWSATLGHSFNGAWLNSPQGNFGLSSVATGVAGGFGSPATPAYGLFGGATGIQSGFMAGVLVPEPSTVALTGLGAAGLLIFRTRKSEFSGSSKAARIL